MTTKEQKSNRFLDGIETIGNKLPHPFFIFLYLAIFVMVLSFIFSLFDATVKPPGADKALDVKNLFSNEGIEYIFTNLITNFTGFAPLGLVISMMIGVGLAEKVGFLEYIIQKTIVNAPPALITYAVVFIGIMGNIASDAATILIPPLAAMVFYKLGRHPVAGLAAGFAAAGAGFTANLLVVGTDALLAGISTESAKIIDPDMVVSPVANWYFNIISTVLLTFVGAQVTTKIIEPRLGEYNGHIEDLDEHEDSPTAKKAFIYALIAAAIYILIFVVGLLIPNSPLLGEKGDILESPFLAGIVPVILGFFLVVGTTFGIVDQKIKSTHDVGKFMTQAVNDMSGYIVLIFAASQFISFFQWSNMATWIAVNGADFLKSIHLTGLPLILLYIIFTACLNLLITSGSAKWALEAPVFVPMFMQLGIHPGFTQAAYRVADSSFNIVTPLNPYFVVIIAFLNKYDKKAGIGTLISLMIPYTVSFIITWIILLAIFYLTGLPLGPGVTRHL
ncbi:AbgT family transporter [Mammaliicoccus sciuri]|uniref:AbgT family transporter n=1 Tax=Mammaliicoccus sciuri TaxID=1296 RepID=UPI001E653E15|nr:AbgT family transporter [Mammaliicoccus sciuri]MCD8796688.1 AbgT family transporter [Mammaliicoccus sciuri]MCJ0952429.1 AbgT family transporter [Mammaliicoccus sciuri]